MTASPGTDPGAPPSRDTPGVDAPHRPGEALALLAVSCALQGLVLLVPEGAAGSLAAALRPTLQVLAWTAPAYVAAERRGRDPLVVHGLLVRPARVAGSLGLALATLPLYALGFLALVRGARPTELPLLAAGERALIDLPFAALPEEYFFRGALQPSVAPGRPWLAIGLASLAFAVAHVVFAPGHSPERLLTFFPSLVFGWLRWRTGSIVPGIVFHALCNGVEVLVRGPA